MPPKPCPDNKVRNPETGRCVSRAGKIGRKVRSNAPSLATSSPAPPARLMCPPAQVRNPATGRCVSRTGAIGKRVLGTNAGRAAATANDERRRAEREARNGVRSVPNSRPVRLSAAHMAMRDARIRADRRRRVARKS
jgi:hypothetical protein